MVLKILADPGGVTELSSTHEAVSAHHGNNHTPLMERYCRSHRSTLKLDCHSAVGQLAHHATQLVEVARRSMEWTMTVSPSRTKAVQSL